MQIKKTITIIKPHFTGMQKGPTLPKQKPQQSLPIYLSTCIHPTTLRNKRLTKICET